MLIRCIDLYIIYYIVGYIFKLKKEIENMIENFNYFFSLMKIIEFQKVGVKEIIWKVEFSILSKNYLIQVLI